MNVLIVGGNRFVGYLLTWRLIAGGHQVTVFNRGSLPDPFGDRIERIRGDRTTADFARLAGNRDWGAVIDFAAYQGEDGRTAVEVLSGRTGHYVMISTGQVYLVRDHCSWPAQEVNYDGPVIPEPSDPHDRKDWLYGVGKRATEDALVAAADRLPSTRLRIPMVNGERDYFRRIESYLWRILDGKPVVLPDGGINPCRHVYGAEVARLISEILGNPATFGQAYNLSQDEEPTLAELVAALAQLLGAPARLASVSAEALAAESLRPIDISPFSDAWMSRLDGSRARRELGFRHEPLLSYLGKIVASFLANPPTEPPANYRHRQLELRLASRSQKNR